jgi:hypothetical protein
MAEEKDPNAAKAESPMAAADAPGQSGAETTSIPDQPDADLTGSDQQPAVSEAAKQPELANPAAGTAHTPSIAEETAPSDEEPVASPLPSANKPDMQPAGGERQPEPAAKATVGAPEATPTAQAAAGKAEPKPAKAKPAAAEGAADGKPARAKKEKAPTIEDKPFTEFINQDFLPNLRKTLTTQGVQDLDLKFEKRSLPVKGIEDTNCWQVIGQLDAGKQFVIGFLKEDINASKVFCCAGRGATPSLLESFMIDERRVNLDLMLFYTVQRLNGQKWLDGN